MDASLINDNPLGVRHIDDEMAVALTHKMYLVGKTYTAPDPVSEYDGMF